MSSLHCLFIVHSCHQHCIKARDLTKGCWSPGPQGQNYLSLLCDPPSSPFLSLSAPTMLVSLSSLSHSMLCLPCTRPSCDWSLIPDIAFPFIFPLCFSQPRRRGWGWRVGGGWLSAALKSSRCFVNVVLLERSHEHLITCGPALFQHQNGRVATRQSDLQT